VKTIISRSLIEQFREVTFRTKPDFRVKSPSQALDFVNERGFIFFWPITKVLFPSLWAAVAGNRPVPDNHDDPGHITWGWKDDFLDKKVWYYGRVLKHRNSIISLRDLPYFYALSPNFGDPEADLQEDYLQGNIPLEVKLVFQALVENGPLDTLSLRKASRLTAVSAQSTFDRAIDILQRQLRILPVGISQAGAWKYAFIYDLTHRYYPDLSERSRVIPESTAREFLMLRYFRSMGTGSLRTISGFFNWTIPVTEKAASTLILNGSLVANIEIAEENIPCYSLSEFVK
jgi:hypothetical protein